MVNLIDYVPTASNVEHYCKIVKEMSVRRQLILHGQRIQEMAYGEETLDEVIPEARDSLSTIASNMDSFGGVSISDLVTMEMRKALYQKQLQTIDKQRFITEFTLLDREIRGIAPGEVLTIIAEPGGFKTAFLQNLLIKGAKRTKKRNLLFSMEMPAEKILERDIQIACGCSGWDVERHFNGQGSPYVEEKALRENGLIVCTKTRLTIEKMIRYKELADQKFGGVGAIGIDFLQLMAGTGKLVERIEHNSYGIKTMAKELNIPVILLSQINVEGRKEKFDINFLSAKGGGAIEESADTGLGFYFDKAGKLVCKILKNRNGGTGTRFEVDVNRKAFQFIDFLEYNQKKSKSSDEDESCPY